MLGLTKIKIELEKTEDLNWVIQALDQNDTEYHTYKPKVNKSFRVVMKALLPSTGTDFI